MALQIAAIANSIAGLSVSGVIIKDIDEVPKTIVALGPTIFPLPISWVTDIVVTPMNFGTGSSRLLNVEYTLTYRFCYAQVGSSDISSNFSGMVGKVFLFFDAIFSNDLVTGLIDLELSGTSSWDVVLDLADVPFFGCDIQLRVLEFADDN